MPIVLQVEGIETQGSPTNPDDYAETFTVTYTEDGTTWTSVTDEDGEPQVSQYCKSSSSTTFLNFGHNIL